MALPSRELERHGGRGLVAGVVALHAGAQRVAHGGEGREGHGLRRARQRRDDRERRRGRALGILRHGDAGAERADGHCMKEKLIDPHSSAFQPPRPDG